MSVYFFAEELHNSEREKTCQAARIQTLEGSCVCNDVCSQKCLLTVFTERRHA